MCILRTSVVVLILVSFCFAADAPRKVTRRVEPQYPELAKRMNASGTVRLQVIVAKDGSVTGVTVLGGHPLLAAAAENAVRKWRYEPGSESTQTVEFRFTGLQQ